MSGAESGSAIVIGGGQVGAALARLLAAARVQVTVASLTERAHAGLWTRWDALSDRVEALLRRSGAAPRVWIAAGGGRGGVDEAAVRGLVLALGSAGVRQVTAVRPLGEDAPLGDATVVTVGPLFGTADTCVSPLLPALRAGRGVRLPRGLPASRPLYAEDAARAILRLGATGGRHRLVGPEVVTAPELARALTARFGGKVGARWLGGLPAGAEQVCRLSVEGPDEWDGQALGERLSLGEWIERLPGPRPRR